VSSALSYARSLVKKAGKTLANGDLFAKVLTPNDDSGRHGVLIPSDAYSFFPDFAIPDPSQNATLTFEAFDTVSNQRTVLAYKYYERYPERRITRLQGLINDREAEPRLVVFLRARHVDGTSGYYVDCANSRPGGRFGAIFSILFGSQISPNAGVFITRPVDAPAFVADANLAELLQKFDAVKAEGWIDSLREGDTGIGYTFETLLGIKENNDRRADFKGIELKCKAIREGAAFAAGKINLFQQGPTWLGHYSAKDRIRLIGKRRSDGCYTCHSQITTTANNLGLSLLITDSENKIDLRKKTEELGYWSFASLESRLKEKHARAAVIKAATRAKESTNQFKYDEIVYCERPSIDRFVTLVRNKTIVFEFLMYEKANGQIRNRGYPWRLIREEFLDQLFSFQIKLR
jgi:hypothetical protein